MMRLRERPSAVDPPLLGEWLRRAASTLAAAGVESPRPDAERLAAHGLGIRWTQLWSRLREPLNATSTDMLDTLVRRRADGEPLPYILGTAVFFGHELVCGPGVFCPRPETERVCEVALELLERMAVAEHPVVVDVGTGSGAVAIAIASEHPRAHVWATEVSADALRYAEENTRALAPAVRLVAGDLLTPLPGELRGRIDLIVSNPPYVPVSAPERVARDVGAEPPGAVFAGPSGDEVLSRLCGQATTWLRPGGLLVCEVGDMAQIRAVRVAERWAESGWERDRGGHPRVVWAQNRIT